MTPKFYVVGGAVRDALFGLTPSDIDYLVVGATPEWMVNEGYVQVGADFPVFLKDGEEYALARTERKSGKGYHGFETNWAPDVTVEDDLRRRDLTVNSMAVPLEKWDAFLTHIADGAFSSFPELVLQEAMDKFVIGATADIASRTIRANSSAFIEDPVRVFRAVRFANTLPDAPWTYADETREDIKAMVRSDDFQHLTKERVVQEVVKAAGKCNAGQFGQFITDLYHFGAFPTVFADYDPLYMRSWITNRLTCDISEDEAIAMIAWSIVPLDISVEQALTILRDRKYSNSAIKFTDALMSIVREVELPRRWDDTETIMKMVTRFKPDLLTKAVEFATKIDAIDHETRRSLLYAASIWNTVNFDTLTEHQQQILFGPQIAEALADIRRGKINEFLHVIAWLSDLDR